jgi:hypothetical protein
LAGIGSAIFTGCRPLASGVPPNGSPNGFDQKSVGALQSAPIAFLPLLVNSAPFFLVNSPGLSRDPARDLLIRQN